MTLLSQANPIETTISHVAGRPRRVVEATELRWRPTGPLASVDAADVGPRARRSARRGPRAASLAALLLAASTSLANAQDMDGDLVPDAVDNCLEIANGPNELSNQVDTDQDGYGNRCDPDFNNDGLVAGRDVNYMFASFGGVDPLVDLNGDGVPDGSDLSILTNLINRPPGPSGMVCADPLIDVEAGDPPCTP